MSPGSRNTPLSLALADSGVTDWSHHDERSAAFFALGIAKTTGSAVVIVTTSGTAAAELHPALAEAINGRVPLIAITADRPTALRNVGAPQTIDQQDLFGRSVKWSHDIEVPPDPREAIDLATRMWVEAMSPPAGPVHLNLRFDEPLMPTDAVTSAADGIPDVAIGRCEPDESAIASLAADLSGRRGIVIAGTDSEPGLAEAAAVFAAAANWPILADPLSGLRAGHHDRSHVLAASDALSWAGFLDAAQPEAVVRFGGIPTSKPIWQWLGNHREVPQVFIEPAGWRDPTFSASVVLRSEVVPTLHLLAKAMGDTTETSWMTRWQNADRAAAAAVTGVIEGNPFPNEPMVARIVSQALPDPGVLWVASSMPVRDLDAVMLPTERRVRVLANRGANGIDGFVSTALGSGAVSGVATVALAGDLSMLHDLSALATAARLDLPVTIVAVNNDGGGIFHLLPQAGHDHFERHWGTPHGLDLAAVATALGVESETVSDASRLTELVSTPPAGPRFIEVRTDRTANANLHRRIRSAVVESLAQI